VLDYILSKMVLLIFLLLLVAAFTMVKQSLNVYFVQQAAQNLASSLADSITRVLTSVRSTSEIKIYRLPPVLEAGNMRLDLNVVVYDKGNVRYVGVVILDHRTKKPIAFDTVPAGDPQKVSVTVHRVDGVVATSSGTKEQYFIVERTYDLGTGQVYLTLCVRDAPTGC